jgi:hypothetical protein
MMIERADLKRLRLSFAVALLLAGLGAGTLATTDRSLDEAKQQRLAAQAQLKAARERVAAVSEEETEIRNNLVHYQKMVGYGLTRPDKRLEWIEAIGDIRKRLNLFEVQYNIAPPHLLDYPGIAQVEKAGSALFTVSRVKLNMQVLHEEKLLSFLADLAAAGPYTSTRNCSVSRIAGAGAGGGPLKPRLQVDCVVDFITLKAPGTT